MIGGPVFCNNAAIFKIVKKKIAYYHHIHLIILARLLLLLLLPLLADCLEPRELQSGPLLAITGCQTRVEF